jgi:hypothetical protein
MSAIYPVSIHRRIERQWAERVKSAMQIRSLVVAATERTLQRVFIDHPPIPAGSVTESIQLDRAQSRD